MMKLKMRLCILAFLLVSILGLASACSEQSNISKEGLDMIQALNDTRDIRVSKELSVGVVERVYYVAKDQVGNAFNIPISIFKKKRETVQENRCILFVAGIVCDVNSLVVIIIDERCFNYFLWQEFVRLKISLP